MAAEQSEGGKSWALLVVGGTPGETYGYDKRPWPDPGQQVSFLQTLGTVYSSLVESMGKDRVIVVAGLQYVLDWLDEAAKIGHPPCEEHQIEQCIAYTRVGDPAKLEEQKQLYKSRAEMVRTSCRELLENGGADYDGERVSPDIVLSILSGRRTSRQSETDRVIPQTGVDSVFVWLTTHGGHHSVAVGVSEWRQGDPEYPKTSTNKVPVRIETNIRPCDLCGNPHIKDEQYDHEHSSLRTREWFMLMPRRSADPSSYGHVTHAGRDMDVNPVTENAGGMSPLTCIYWQQVVSAIAPGCQSGRKIVMLYQFCTSGGHCKWLSHTPYQKHYLVNKWPVFQMATSREQQFSLGATFTNIYMSCVAEGLLTDQTLDEAFKKAEQRYWEQHKVEARMNAQAASPGLRFGELVQASGSESNIGSTALREVFVNSKM
eukprot:TRINITY_DN2018_c0_g1_i1.p1 TRINITY_DN2018_c0_g1~~TRINITY_DN2018_c0_g1_i1.p1  ORF type:complete len:459 (+),score=29.78 TRINITY_DN2018_c0_g1_i1:88-1377(+)